MLRKTLAIVAVLSATSVWACSNPKIENALSKDLSKYKTINVTVDDCVATLNGQVDRLSDKMTAARKAHKYGDLTAVIDNIQVVSPVVEDDKLADEVAHLLLRDRARNFNLVSFAVTAHDGEVTVSGLSYSQGQRDDALSLIASIRGVRQIQDYITISPVASVFPYLTDPHAQIYGWDCAGTIAECGNQHP